MVKAVLGFFCIETVVVIKIKEAARAGAVSLYFVQGMMWIIL